MKNTTIDTKQVKTIAQIAKDTGLSRARIYELIQLGKLNPVELPLFVEIDGQKIEVERKRFIVYDEGKSPLDGRKVGRPKKTK